MSLETWQASYPTIAHGKLQNLSMKETVSIRQETEPKDFVWSARLSTGIFGLVDCPSGNSPHAPKGANEVLIAVGDESLSYLIDLGFVSCPKCHPENQPKFWDKAENSILHKYPNLSDKKEVLDRNLLPFDAMRVNWERLAPMLNKMPNRIYTQPNLDGEVLAHFKQRIESLGFKLPPVGFYDRTSETRFTEYLF